MTVATILGIFALLVPFTSPQRRYGASLVNNPPPLHLYSTASSAGVAASFRGDIWIFHLQCWTTAATQWRGNEMNRCSVIFKSRFLPSTNRSFWTQIRNDLLSWLFFGLVFSDTGSAVWQQTGLLVDLIPWSRLQELCWLFSIHNFCRHDTAASCLTC